MKVVSTGYTPRPLQAELHKKLKRFNVLVCHRRFGKSVFCINEMIDQMLRCPHKRPQAAYLAPTYSAVKRIAWEYLKEFAKNIPGVKTHEGELRLDIPRPWMGDYARIMLLGAENYQNLRGIYLDLAILDEYGEMDPEAFTQVIRPALSDRTGRAIFIGTVRGENHFWQLYNKVDGLNDWFRALYRASETKIIPEEELNAAREVLDESTYMQEFECDPTAALKGSYYGDQMSAAEKSGRITSVPHQPDFPVHTAWDLGISDVTAIWFYQQVGREFHFIDYLESSDKGLDFYAKELIARSYLYGTHYLPHDIMKRELSTGKERIVTLRNLGLKNLRVVPKAMSIADDINAARVILPRCWFDSLRCEKGIAALKNYQRQWDSKDRVYAKRPLHNWASHGADAFRTFASGFRDEFSLATERRFREADGDYNALEA